MSHDRAPQLAPSRLSNGANRGSFLPAPFDCADPDTDLFAVSHARRRVPVSPRAANGAESAGMPFGVFSRFAILAIRIENAFMGLGAI
jgi:hypothetical protein